MSKGDGGGNGFSQPSARIHSDLVLPEDDFGWLGEANSQVKAGQPADVRPSQHFRVRINVRRVSLSTEVTETIRLQLSLNNGSFSFVTDVSSTARLRPTVRHPDGQDNLKLLLTSGFIADPDNGGYQSEGDGSTDLYSWPGGFVGARRFEPEWSCFFPVGGVAAGDSLRFRALLGTGAIFDGFYAFGTVDVADEVVNQSVDFRSEIGPSVRAVSDVRPSGRARVETLPSGRAGSGITPSVRMRTGIGQSVRAGHEVI